METHPLIKKLSAVRSVGAWIAGLLLLDVLCRGLLLGLTAKFPTVSLPYATFVNHFGALGLLAGVGYGSYALLRLPRKVRSVAGAPMAITGEVARLTVNQLTETPPTLWQGLAQAAAALWQRPAARMVTARARRHLSADAEADARLRQLVNAVETMPLGVTITDMRGKILYTNPAEAAMHGYAVSDLVGQDLGIFAPKRLRRPMTTEQMRGLKTLRESVNIRKDGTLFPVRLMANLMTDHAGRPFAIVTMCEDITEQKRAADAKQQRTRELALLNRMNSLLQACQTEQETYAAVSHICRKLFPNDAGCLAMLATPQRQVKVVSLWGAPQHALRAAQEPPPQGATDGAALCPYRNFCAEHDCLCVPIGVSGEMLGMLSLCFRPHRHLATQRAVLTRVAEHYALALVNLRVREHLRIESIRDALTGLYNRRYMEESLAREAYRAKRHDTAIGIIMLDIDHFKQVNDTYGHEVGDAVLRQLGGFLQEHVRGEDIACRYGGEEFLLILPEVSSEAAYQRAEALRLGVQALRREPPLPITISLGVAVLTKHDGDVKAVLAAADKALYHAKHHGRNRTVRAAEMPHVSYED